MQLLSAFDLPDEARHLLDAFGDQFLLAWLRGPPCAWSIKMEGAFARPVKDPIVTLVGPLS